MPGVTATATVATGFAGVDSVEKVTVATGFAGVDSVEKGARKGVTAGVVDAAGVGSARSGVTEGVEVTIMDTGRAEEEETVPLRRVTDSSGTVAGTPGFGVGTARVAAGVAMVAVDVLSGVELSARESRRRERESVSMREAGRSRTPDWG